MNPFFVIESTLTAGTYAKDFTAEGSVGMNYTYDVDEAYKFTNEDEARGVLKFLKTRWGAIKLTLVTENPRYSFEQVD